jgi:hypothetical protein
MNRKFCLIALLITGACASSPAEQHDYHSYLNNKGVYHVSPEQFGHCHGYGCKYVARVSFNKQMWKDMERIFTPRPESAKEERKRLALAISWFEHNTGALTGTGEDIKGTFKKFGANQLDCVDESTNTTVYLSLMEQLGYLRFHRIRKPQMRAPFFGGGNWPHQSAVITEKETGKEFAVDSWFEDNGKLPYIVPLDEWTWGWRPPES